MRMSEEVKKKKMQEKILARKLYKEIKSLRKVGRELGKSYEWVRLAIKKK